MREPNCRRIVSSKDLWEIAIDFMGVIDEELMEFNMKFAYITYRICKLKRIPNRIISKLVFLSCFNDIGKLYAGENASTARIETYLFLKYFSPIKNYADVLIYETKSKMSNIYSYGTTLEMCKRFTTYLFQLKDAESAQRMVLIDKDKKDYTFVDIMCLNKLLDKTDIFYEMNSLHYKTVVHKYISKTIFTTKEESKFFSMLSALFEMYSAQTLYHSRLTAIVAYLISKKMKLEKARCKKVYVAGLCHDLGKVSIPLKILEKPDKLTDREYSIMKKHVTYTKEILNYKMDYDIIELAYRHHEKLDGSGYPNKLKADSITLDQRILQVSDIISALMAKRSYKEAWSSEKTIAILDDLALTNKLDQNVVDCFKTNQNKIIKITGVLMGQADRIYDKINIERQELMEQENSPVKEEAKAKEDTKEKETPKEDNKEGNKNVQEK